MLVSVTSLGSRAGDAAGAAGAVLAYLDGRRPGRRGPERAGAIPAEQRDAPEAIGPAAYYADSVEGPGTWIGHGIDGITMSGTVEPAELRRLLLAQDPRTGTPLRALSSRRRAPYIEDSAVPLSTAAAATQSGVSARYLRRVLAKSEEAEARRIGEFLAGMALTPPPSTYLPSARDERGRRVIDGATLDTWCKGQPPRPVVVGYDVTFSAPKSVSILWAAGDKRVRSQVLAAIDASVAAGVAYLEQHGAHVRSRGDRLPTDGILAASYLHGTSRTLDPQLHRHVVLGNVAAAPDGTILALDGTALYAHAKTAGYLAASELRWQLTNRLGVEWHEPVNGLADIDGIPIEAVKAMSTRTSDIERAAAELGATSAASRQIAAWATRTAKDRSVDPEALRPWWQERLAAAGFDSEALDRVVSRAAAPAPNGLDAKALLARLGGPHGVTEQANSFDRRDVVQWLAAKAQAPLPAEVISALADRWLGSEAVIPLDTAGRTPKSVRAANTRLFTTPVMVEIEARIDERFAAGLGAGRAVVPRELAAATVAARPELGEDQIALVLAVTTSGNATQCALGPAGTGKTFALDAAARAWEQAGYRVIGAAVQGTAAEVLGRATGVAASTIASLLVRLDTAQPGYGPLNERTVVIVDEASTIANRDLDRLLAHAEAAGAAVRLVGDPAQHSAVAAGGAWRALVERHPDETPRLTVLRRQAGEHMGEVRLALTAYREGHVADALERLDRDQRVVTASTADDLLDQLVADWYLDRRLSAGGAPTSSMVAEHHSERCELNRRARALLTADGTLRGPALDAAGTALRAGDEVIARCPDRTLRPAGADRHTYVRNGSRGHVTRVDVEARSVTVDFDGRGPIEVSWSYLTKRLRPGVTGGLAHSYALTSHASQGETYRAARHLATDRSTRKAVYVGLTRGRDDVRLYMVRNRDLHAAPVDDDLPRIADNASALEAIGRRLAEGGDEHLASELDPLVPLVPDALANRSIAELVKYRHNDPLAAAAVRIAVQRATAFALANPPHELVDRLGPRPAGGTARRSWDEAIRAWALEQRELPAEHDRRVAELVDLAEASVLADTHPRQLRYLRSHAETPARIAAIDDAIEAQVTAAARRPAAYLLGLLGEPGPTRWQDDADAVERYRHEVLAVAPGDGPLGDNPVTAALGPRPDGLDAARWEALAQKLTPPTQQQFPLEL